MTMHLTETGTASEAATPLQALAADLAGRGFGTVVTHGAGMPVLSVTSPAKPDLSERITITLAGDGARWFTWSWGDRLARITDVEAAAFKIAYVLTLRAGG